jgi:hypothetical protein
MNIIKYTDSNNKTTILLVSFNGSKYIIKHIYTNMSAASTYFKIGNCLEIFMGCIHVDNKKLEITTKQLDSKLLEILNEQCRLRDEIQINEEKIKELDYKLMGNSNFREILF